MQLPTAPHVYPARPTSHMTYPVACHTPYLLSAQRQVLSPVRAPLLAAGADGHAATAAADDAVRGVARRPDARAADADASGSWDAAGHGGHACGVSDADGARAWRHADADGPDAGPSGRPCADDPDASSPAASAAAHSAAARGGQRSCEDAGLAAARSEPRPHLVCNTLSGVLGTPRCTSTAMMHPRSVGTQCNF